MSLQAPEHAPSGPHRVLVIGVGNMYRGDDAAGLAVVQRLREKSLQGVSIVEHHSDVLALLETLRNASGDVSAIVVVDAVCSGARTGTVHRFNIGNVPTLPQYSTFSTHAFGLKDTLQLARTLNLLPAHSVLYGIEVENFAEGVGLSPPVEKAVEVVVEQVARELSTPERT